MCALAALMPTPVDQELKYMPNGWTVFSALYELFGLARPRCLSTPADGGMGLMPITYPWLELITSKLG